MGPDFCIGVLFYPIVFAVIFVVTMAVARGKAKKAYYESLERLEADPHNPGLRAETLALGRKYGALLWGSRRAAIFDEVALMDDVYAAYARAGPRAKDEGHASPQQTVEERLHKLEDLRKKGLITADEYRSRREQILDDV